MLAEPAAPQPWNMCKLVERFVQFEPDCEQRLPSTMLIMLQFEPDSEQRLPSTMLTMTSRVDDRIDDTKNAIVFVQSHMFPKTPASLGSRILAEVGAHFRLVSAAKAFA